MSAFITETILSLDGALTLEEVNWTDNSCRTIHVCHKKAYVVKKVILWKLSS